MILFKKEKHINRSFCGFEKLEMEFQYIIASNSFKI
jgi:hypothetical protein